MTRAIQSVVLSAVLVMAMGATCSGADPAGDPAAAPPAPPALEAPSAAFMELRNAAIHKKPADAGITITGGEPAVWGAVMEWTLSNGRATLVSLVDGSAHVYLTNGGGEIAGQGQQTVREASAAFIREAGKHLAETQEARAFPLPEAGETRFYLLTPTGVRTARVADVELRRHEGPLFPLAVAGQGVITKLRLASENSGGSASSQ